jgi:hypothetical protein
MAHLVERGNSGRVEVARPADEVRGDEEVSDPTGVGE